jgi:hypothetical protein
MYTYNNQGNFDVSEYRTAVIAGAIAGGLIGSGIGILAGPAVTIAAANTAAMAIGAGTSATITGSSYIASNPDNFMTTPFVIQTGTSAVAAAITSNPGIDIGIKILANVGASETSYFTSGGNHPLTGAIITGAIATVATGAQFGVDTYAEENLMINRPLQSNFGLISDATKQITSQNIRTVIYSSVSGITTGLAISAGAWIQKKFKMLDQ